MNIVKLDWAPIENCSYDNVVASTPFGCILITWKGWKESPSMVIDDSPWGADGYIGSEVEESKLAAEAKLRKLCKETLAILGDEP